MSAYVQIDLKKYVNHKILLDTMEQQINVQNHGIHFQGLGPDRYYQDSRQFEEKNYELMIKDIPFKITGQKIDGYDNIACCEQEIKLTPDRYQKLYLLGFTISGTYQQEIVLDFEDGIREIQSISLLDWVVEDRFSGWSSYGVNNTFFSSGAQPAFIGIDVAKTIKVGMSYYAINITQNTKRLQKITLPDFPIMHIMAITLEK